MKENKILASVALFSELYNNKKDIYDVIAEFIKAAILSESKWTLNATEATQLLDKVFDFKIPEAVVKTTLKNRLKQENILSFNEGIYTFIAEKIVANNLFEKEFTATKNGQAKIFENLIDYVEIVTNKRLLEEERDELNKNFNSYLLDNGVPDKHSQYISSYIIENQNNNGFTESLNTIKEGLILYTGIRYTSDLNDLGTWNNDLTVFLDTEHLFNATGFNGIIYEEIFNDFYKLVKDINANSSKEGSKRIKLKYFDEIKQDVENFFFVAEKILEGKTNLDPSKTAMQFIVNGCKSPSDVVTKKNKFFKDLKIMGIQPEDKFDYYKHHEFNIEDVDILNELKKQSVENNKYFDEEECIRFLRLFTKVNVLRNGISNTWFEKIGFILLSGKSIAYFLAHNNHVKINERDVPFSTDLDFITDKFWFKLKKGFSDKQSLPKSFDIITKAQIVLSSQINNTISKEYSRLTDEFKKGNLSKEDAISLNYDLRERTTKPEDITPDIIDYSLAFLNENSIENHLREKSILMKKAAEGEKAIKELNKIKTNKWLKQKKIQKKNINYAYYALLVSYWLIVSSVLAVVVSIIYNLADPNDTILTIGGVLLTLILGIIPLWKYNRYVSALKMNSKRAYKKRIEYMLSKNI